MIRISTALTILLTLISGVFIVLWILSPENNWEPWAALASAVLIPLVQISRNRINVIYDPSRASKLTHDCGVFEQIELLIDEDFIVRFTNETGGSARCLDKDQHKLENFVEEMSKTKYEFLTETIEHARLELKKRAIEVQQFLRYNFDSLDNPNLHYTKMCKPEENPYGIRPEYKGLAWDDLYKLLHEQLMQLNDTYGEYRREIKMKLHL